MFQAFRFFAIVTAAKLIIRTTVQVVFLVQFLSEVRTELQQWPVFGVFPPAPPHLS